MQLFIDGECVKTHPFQQRGRRTDFVDLPEERVGFFMRTPSWCRIQAGSIGPATDALVAELLSLNALFRLRQAQGVLRLVDEYGAARVEAACRRALEVGDPCYRTVKGILMAGTENEATSSRSSPASRCRRGCTARTPLGPRRRSDERAVSSHVALADA